MCMKRILPVLLVLFTNVFVGCEKESDLVIPHRPQVGADDLAGPGYDYNRYSSEAKLRDSVYYYTDYFYLWQNQLPQNFNPHIYRTADQVLAALKTYAKKPNGQPIDRYSFLDRSGTIFTQIQEGMSGSFGFEVRYLTEQDLYIKLVDEGSPAYLMGLRRGWQITEINDRRDLSLASMEADNYEFLFRALYDSPSIQIRAKNPAGQELRFVIHRANYPIQPVLAHKIFDVAGQKVGYFAFNSFVSVSLIRNRVENIMNEFSAAGVKKLIVDLRYNGGGDVATADYLSNLIAPTSANNKKMNDYKINQNLKYDGWDFLIFYPSYFYKTNSFNPDRIYFLVTNSTASASELLINNLTPYIDVKLIGDNKTYGKPVGYFGWDIMGVDLYAISFQTVNANNYGDYFDGMEIDQYAQDGVNKDFGDPQESMIATALYHIQHGTFATAPGGMLMSKSAPNHQIGQLKDFNQGLEQRRLKDMFIFNRAQ